MAKQIKKKFIADKAVDGEKIELEAGQALKQDGQELIKLDAEGKVQIATGEAATKQDVSDVKGDLVEGDLSTIKALSDAIGNLDGNYATDAEVDQKIAAVEGDLSNATYSTIQALDSALAAEITRATGVENGLDTRIQSLENDTSSQDELDATQTGAGLSADGSYVAKGDANYISAATSLKDADDKLDAQVKVNADAIAQEVLDRQSAIDEAKLALGTNYSVAVKEDMIAHAQADVGDVVFVSDDGDAKWAMYIRKAKSETSVESDFQKIADEDAFSNSLTKEAIKAAYESNADTNAFTDAEKQEIVDLRSDLNSEKNPTLEGSLAKQIADVQLELDTTQGGAGLSADGSYVAEEMEDIDMPMPHQARYISAATSLKDADKMLDDALKVHDDELATMLKLDGSRSMEAALSMGAEEVRERYPADPAANAGTIYELFHVWDSFLVYIPNLETSTIFGGTEDPIFKLVISKNELEITDNLESFKKITKVSINELDPGGFSAPVDKGEFSVVFNSDVSDPSNINGLQQQNGYLLFDFINLGATQFGPFNEIYSFKAGSSNKITGLADGVAASDAVNKGQMDAALASAASNTSALQSELDDTQTGAGLALDGSYVAKGDANYISAATSLKDADDKLDAQVKVNADAIATEKGRIDVLNGDSSVEGSVAKAISDVIDMAPEALNTLNELAAAIGDDANFAATVTQMFTDLKGGVSEAFDTMKEIEDEFAKINGDSSVVGSIDAKVAAEAQLRSDADTALSDRASALESVAWAHGSHTMVGSESSFSLTVSAGKEVVLGSESVFIGRLALAPSEYAIAADGTVTFDAALMASIEAPSAGDVISVKFQEKNS